MFNNGRLSIGISALLIIALILGFALWFKSVHSSSQALTIPSNWISYHDPDGYFTLKIPPNWNVKRTLEQAEAGNNTTSVKYTTVTTVFNGPTSGDSNGISLAIYIEPHTDPYLHQSACEKTFANNATLSGLPAYYTLGTWILDTQDTHYQINFDLSDHFSTGVNIRPGTPVSTSIPSAIITTNQQVITLILSLFEPKSTTSLQCY